ncbi:GDSL lipase/esterase [Dillenia turbinata]|uniref:GDSL lipase/esterase n=1 Tax=Dillenia turbinata TaxID=194707 RepID=A0AAN8Z8T1_9MAGN
MDWLRSIYVIGKWKWVLRFGVCLVVAYLILQNIDGRSKPSSSSGSCHFPAVFNFGDSNSDTGAVSAAFNRVLSPNGITFFGKPSGRYCDGRLIIDFIAEKLELPFLSAYLNSIGANFRNGANFAASGCTIEPTNVRLCKEGFNPLTLDVQLSQFEQFKQRTVELYNQAQSSPIKNILPRPEDFSKALYTLDIGQNDLNAGIISMTDEEISKSVPSLIDRFAKAIEQLYQQGARSFWIHNTGPIGCLPYITITFPPKPENVDENGCVKSYNKLAQEFNKQMEDRMSLLRNHLDNAMLVYVDIYTAKYSLIREPKKHGFVDPHGYCCGHYGDYHVECGEKTMINGTEIHGTSCSNPPAYISWDGIHYSDAANQWVAHKILDGSFSDPPISIAEACFKTSSKTLT